MKYQLKGFQAEAARTLAGRMAAACDTYYRHHQTASCCLAAPTGAGKTVISAAVIEGLFNGNSDLGINRDPRAAVLWVCDSPSLNMQTMQKFLAATDLDISLVETIENTFTQYHHRLEPGHIYFLNRQKLAGKNILVKGGEVPTFWSLLKDTINDPSVHLYMVLDEAHKGLGKADRGDKDKDTIYGKIIDGEDGRTPIPVIVGISATPQRFQTAMESREERTPFKTVAVSPRDVQESGLLKEKIVLSVPSADDKVKGLYLSNACKALNDSTQLWKSWCTNNDMATITPLLVIQVPDNASDSTLQDISSEVCEHLSWLDRTTSFAHVFGDHAARRLDGFDIPYVSPEDVQRKTSIKVLFAKEAISTGWDCPRAEVIYSMRPHKDGTYIAQLIGRMVRTPLARKVDVDTLNSVRCFLPFFDKKTVTKVVDYLTTEGSDDFSGVSEDSGRKVIINPVDVEWDSSLGVDEVFESICSKVRVRNKASWIAGAYSYTGLLAKYEIDFDAEDMLSEVLLRELNDSITTFAKEMATARKNISHAETTEYTFTYLDADSVSENMYTQDADAYALRYARETADSAFTKALTNLYFRQEYKAKRPEKEINLDIAAAALVSDIVDRITQCAKEFLQGLAVKYDKQVSRCPEPVRADFSEKMYQNGIEHVVYLCIPTKDVQDMDDKTFAKHVVNDPVSHKAYLNISDYEEAVVLRELKRGCIAWYRNPSSGSPEHSLTIQYRAADSSRRSMHPDFIFFEKDDAGEVRPTIVDPHGLYLADATDKLKGFARFVETFGDNFARIWSIADVDGETRYIDLKDQKTSQALLDGETATNVFYEYGRLY